MSDQSQRYFFAHIPRTAGTALRRRMINHFGEAAVYPTEGVDGTDILNLVLSPDLLKDRLKARGDQIRVITGHFPLRTTEQLDGTFTTLTLLRDPVERMLSILRVEQGHPIVRFLERRTPGVTRNVGRPLDEIYEEVRELARNGMTKMLSLTSTEMVGSLMSPTELGREHLELAKEALAGVDAVGLQESFEAFCDQLTGRLGWDLGTPELVNSSSAVDVPEGLRDRIAEDNAFDVELYELARRLVDDRNAHLKVAVSG